MQFDVLTLFPEMISSYCEQSILGIAKKNKLINVEAHNPRNFAKNKAKSVDDVLYGGGAGMLLSPEPFLDCLKNIIDSKEDTELKTLFNENYQEENFKKINHPEKRDYEIIITSPTGEKLDQKLASKLALKRQLYILCGRYEGFDERIKNVATKEISLGDFVLTGGELAALSIIDSSSRLIKGVLGDEDSAVLESFAEYDYLSELQRLGASKKELSELIQETKIELDKLKKLRLLEAPQFTRPFNFHGIEVPKVLSSGDHKKIFLWKLKQAIKLTQERRPDLLD